MLPTLSLEKSHGWPERGIAGVDEAGRGALAGPVVAAAVIFTKTPPKGINDSKLLTPETRARLAQDIIASAHTATGIIASERIDEINILRASLEAMAHAIASLPRAPSLALIDGLHAPKTPCPCQTVIKGDRLSLSIAAASIIAKTCRDALMEDYEARYPGYGFGRNRGYPTAAHRRALTQLGVTKIHRRSYAPVKEACAAD